MKLVELLTFIWKGFPKGATYATQNKDGRVAVTYENGDTVASGYRFLICDDIGSVVTKDDFEEFDKSLTSFRFDEYQFGNLLFDSVHARLIDSIQQVGQLNLHQLVAEIARRECLILELYDNMHGGNVNKTFVYKNSLESCIQNHLSTGIVDWFYDNQGKPLYIFQDRFGKLKATKNIYKNKGTQFSKKYPLAHNRLNADGSINYMSYKNFKKFLTEQGNEIT